VDLDLGQRVKHRESVRLRYRSQQEALQFLGNVLADDRGVGLLHGPHSSGKSAVVNQFVQTLPANAAVAIVDGAHLKARQFLSEVLEQFGYSVELNSADQMLNMLRVIVVQQTRSPQAPVLVVQNINNMYPSTLCVLCKLASQMVQNRFALRIILVNHRYYYRIMGSPSMRPITDRLIGTFKMEPMSEQETMAYVYSRVRSYGVDHPDNIFSVDTCTELHKASGGWPVKLDDIIMTIMDQADAFPVRLEEIDHPALQKQSDSVAETVEVGSSTDQEKSKLIVTLNGKTQQYIELVNSRALIGRSDLSDVTIDSNFVSRQHALLVQDKGAVIIVDLNSRNGTFVNSRRVNAKVLQDSDIIMVGDHRIKLILPSGHASVVAEDPDMADTARMKGIAEARQSKDSDIPTLYVVDENQA
jgi:pSer/pThr/pTyr-binding forkhead associated (FHA) protein/type II secretory pathway predicted ATPase ExeA